MPEVDEVVCLSRPPGSWPSACTTWTSGRRRMPRCRRSSKRRGRAGSAVDPPAARSTTDAGGRGRSGLSGADHDRRRELVVAHDPCREAAGGDERGGGRRLAPARLDEQGPARGEPLASGCRDPTMHVEPVGSAVERRPGLVVACLRRHHRDLPGGHVRRVHGEHVHRPQQVAGQRVEQVARHHTRAERLEVAAGGQHGGGVDVGGGELHVADGVDDGRADRPGAAAQVDDDGTPSSAIAPARRMASAASASVRRRGTNTPGSTTMRRPPNSAQPRSCSSGSPATRRATRRSSSSAASARRSTACASSIASSSAKTQPAARRRATSAGSGRGSGGILASYASPRPRRAPGSRMP